MVRRPMAGGGTEPLRAVIGVIGPPQGKRAGRPRSRATGLAKFRVDPSAIAGYAQVV
jgi:hypothetical protein